MFQGLLLPVFPAEHISQDYIFYSWSYFAFLFWWQGHIIFLALRATHQHLWCGSWPSIRVADHSGARGREGSRACPRRAVVSAVVHPWRHGVALSRLRGVETSRLPPAPRPTQSQWKPRDVALATKHFCCSQGTYMQKTEGWQLCIIYPVSLSHYLIFFLSLWSWLNLLILCCGLHAPTFPLTNIHFQWDWGAEFTSVTQGTLKYT